MTVAPQSWTTMLMGRLESQLDGIDTAGVCLPKLLGVPCDCLIVTSWYEFLQSILYPM